MEISLNDTPTRTFNSTHKPRPHSLSTSNPLLLYYPSYQVQLQMLKGLFTPYSDHVFKRYTYTFTQLVKYYSVN